MKDRPTAYEQPDDDPENDEQAERAKLCEKLRQTIIAGLTHSETTVNAFDKCRSSEEWGIMMSEAKITEDNMMGVVYFAGPPTEIGHPTQYDFYLTIQGDAMQLQRVRFDTKDPLEAQLIEKREDLTANEIREAIEELKKWIYSDD